MTNATKTLAALFVVLLVIAGFIKFSESSSSSHELLTNVITVDTAKVNKIVINTPNKKNLLLSKDGKKWNVQQGNGESYPADESSVENVISMMSNLKPDAIVSHNPKQFTRYEVDSTGTKVNFQNGNNQLASIILGRFQMSGQRNVNTYVRPANQNTVFLVNGFLTRSFNRPLDTWRDKQVWNIPRSNITQFDMVYPADSSYTVVSGGKGSWLYGTDTLKAGIVDNILDHVIRINLNSFADTLKPANLRKPLYTVRLHLKGGDTREVHFTPGVKENKNSFLITASDYPYVGKVEKSVYMEEVLRPLNQLKKKTAKKK